jgi:hypothetical protein
MEGDGVLPVVRTLEPEVEVQDNDADVFVREMTHRG